ncbi:PVC-type heme-binding CxxCH protein [Alienimonas chondri]|uniref:Cytochrome c domain-containing protein n=1 Tax=Alienimonas chondri TaxID=2681879 RepID=A0ABX1V9D6_9PLAN|nr:PVC-type heme-binding CxxCH protein [Alienimonas chondri]NNJ24008.1 hypothetical protein [Alienimonas chondri]
MSLRRLSFALILLAGPAFLPAGELKYAGLPAEEAAAVMRLPDGFRVVPFAAEPDVVQPIAMTIDHRGRLWVAEGHSYPVKRPEGEGKDRILIFEDTDGDGRHDVRKVFAEGLNLVSGLEVGFGGVFVGQAPHLLFIPDADGDDVPDGPPEVLLDGWHDEDTHETLNSFIWGPDGWLYGCHGVFTHSRVGPPGTPDDQRVPINAGIWRYHPTSRAFEVFAHGTSNPWGVDFDERGQSFLTCCVIPHLFHVIPGARYFRQAGRHFDPHVYEDIPTIAKHRHFVGHQWTQADREASLDFGGGHAHAGAMIYQGDAWPAEFRGQLLMNNIHGARLNADSLTPSGSGFVGDRLPDFCLTDDLASQMLYLRTGPDGNVFVIDWYDTNQCHHRGIENHDRSNGRIWKIVHENPVTPRPRGASALQGTSEELVDLLTHENVFQRRQAQRLLQERGPDEAAVEALGKMYSSADSLDRLRALWALTATATLTGEQLDAALGDEDADVRLWGVRLTGQSLPALPMSGGIPRAIGDLPPLPAFGDRLDVLVEMAKSDDDASVRLELASLAQRLPVDQRWGLLEALLARGEDADDHNLPLMLWYAFEPLVPADAERALSVALAGEIPTVRRLALRRVGELGTAESRAAIVSVISDSAERPERALEALAGLRSAIAGRDVERPAGWDAALTALALSDDLRVLDRAQGLDYRFGTAEAGQERQAVLADEAASLERRRGALADLLDVSPRELPIFLRRLISAEPASPFAADLIRGLGRTNDPANAPFLRQYYPRFAPAAKRAALAVLVARPVGADLLLTAMANEEIPTVDLTADLARQIRSLNDEGLTARLRDVWGTVAETDADRLRLIDSWKRKVAAGNNDSDVTPDLVAGRALFKKTCGQCHELYGEGEKVGPGLTGSNRRDLDYLLSNILAPSAVMAKDYRPTVFLLADGRVLTGLIQAKTDAVVTLATADGEAIVPVADILERTESDTSMMPDGLLTPLSTEQVRNLVAYLRSDSPPESGDE